MVLPEPVGPVIRITPVVFFSPDTVYEKGLEEITKDDIIEAFEEDNLIVFTKAEELKAFIIESNLNESVLLMMSSGNWGGIDLNELSKELLNRWN